MNQISLATAILALIFFKMTSMFYYFSGHDFYLMSFNQLFSASKGQFHSKMGRDSEAIH